MIFYIVIPAIFLITGLILIITRKIAVESNRIITILLLFLFTGLFSGLGATIAGLVGLFITSDEREWVHVSSERLVALRDGDQIEGSFFLATGGIDGVMYAHYFKETGNGGYAYGKERLDSVTIYEDSLGPSKEVNKSCHKGTANKWLAFPDSNCDTGVIEFHVPKGTVDRSYDLDMQ